MMSVVAERVGAFFDRPKALDESTNAFIALAHKARRTSDPVLAFCEFAGFAVAVAISAFSPDRWELALPAVSLGAFGLWGITDHAMSAQGKYVNAVVELLLEYFRVTVAAAGIAAAIGFGYALTGWMMGVWVL